MPLLFTLKAGVIPSWMVIGHEWKGITFQCAFVDANKSLFGVKPLVCMKLIFIEKYLTCQKVKKTMVKPTTPC